MAKYQKYAEYKSINGIGVREVPVHWKRTTFKYILEKIIDNRGRTPPTFDVGIPLLEAKQIDNKSLYASLKFEKFIDQNGYENFIRDDLKYNDILFITVGTIGKTCLVPKESNFVIAQNIIGLRVKKDIDPLFTWFWLNSSIANEAMKATNKDSILDSIKISDFVQAKVYFPNLDEQKAISNFLSHEVLNIDSLIANQEKLIELLKEKRQAVISHAVTKGLNSKVPMKDSGNIWAEKIPNHWKLTKLTYVARVGNGATPSRDNEAYWKDGSIGWLNSSKVNDVIITEADQFITPLAKTQTSVQIVQPNDLVMAITGEGQTRGRVAICQLDATINQHLASIRITDKNLNHEFLFCWLTANYERIRYESTGAGSTKGAITCGDIGLYPVPLPPYAEQLEIVANIKKQSDTFKRLIVKAESAIQLMQERRTALISSAVTGKIDVRNWQNPNNNNEAKTEFSA